MSNARNLANLLGTNTTIPAAKIAADAVTTAKIPDDAITTAKILNNNVTTAKILDGAVTTDKLGTDAVTAAKLQRKFTISTSSPSGGNDGDIWFKYS